MLPGNEEILCVPILIGTGTGTGTGALSQVPVPVRSQQGHTASNVVTAINPTPRELRIL
jgi:hypothetical protein